MRARLGFAGAAVVAAVALLCSGCSDPKMAFSVSGQVTSLATVQATMDACNATLAGTPVEGQATSQWVANTMIHADLAHLVASQQSIAFTDDSLRQSLGDTSTAPWLGPMLDDQTCSPLVLGLVLEQLVAYKLGGTGYATAAANYNVIVNPRLGQWAMESPTDASTWAIVGSGSLSVPDVTPSG